MVDNMIIAGTGHRPKFCPCKYKENHPWLVALKDDLMLIFLQQRPTAVITGMAIGWDTWLAQVALEMGYPVWAYVPFRGQGENWPSSSRNEYKRILEASEKVLYISDEYHNDAFLKRDRAMVDDCDEVFALWNPEAQSGGTYYTVKYAEKNGKPITNFWS